MNDFTPKRIGNKNFELEQKIIALYSDLCNQANDISLVLDSYLGYVDKEFLDPSMFFEFMNCKDPKAFLYSKYIDKHDISFPGISIPKVIELGLADVPLDTFSDLLGNRNKLLKSIQLTEKLNFHFPLINLWIQPTESFGLFDNDDDEDCKFASSDFENKLNQHTGSFTASESDNIILEAIEKAIDSFNNLIHLGIIKNAKGNWINGIARLSDAIVFNGNEEITLSVNPKLKRMYEFKRFFSESKFNPVMGKQQDILKFVAPVPEQLEENQENSLQFEDTEGEDLKGNNEDLLHPDETEEEHPEENHKEIIQSE